MAKLVPSVSTWWSLACPDTPMPDSLDVSCPLQAQLQAWAINSTIRNRRGFLRDLPGDGSCREVRPRWAMANSSGRWFQTDILFFYRFASNIASEGYIVALPSSFHEFEGPEPIPYDSEGTDRGNCYKVGPFFHHISRFESSARTVRSITHFLLGREDS